MIAGQLPSTAFPAVLALRSAGGWPDKADRGLPIDLALTSLALRDQLEASWINIEPRKAERPSDHAPVGVNISAS